MNNKNTDTTIKIDPNVNANITYHNNVDQSIISITEDKMKLILLEYLRNLEDKNSWIAPLGIFVSLGFIPLTSDFKKDQLLGQRALENICYFLIFLSIYWLIRCLWRRWKTRKTTVESIIDKMKKKEA